MKGSMRKMLCLGLTALSMGVMMPGAVSAEKAAITMPQKMANGETVEEIGRASCRERVCLYV